MCTIALAFHAHPRYPLILASNRDEFYARPSEPASFWADHPDLLAGRDRQGGGTWLGINRSGRFAALTNVRQGFEQRPDAPTRGEIVSGFLQSDQDPMAFATALAGRGEAYNGFNLIVGDARSLVLYSNRGGDPVSLEPGIYGLTNAVPGKTWPKAERARTMLGALLSNGQVAPESLLALLSDAERPPDDRLPDTGVGLEWERVLSPIFIRTAEYGTCASTAIVVEANGEALFVERRPVPGKEVSGATEERRFALRIPSFEVNGA